MPSLSDSIPTHVSRQTFSTLNTLDHFCGFHLILIVCWDIYAYMKYRNCYKSGQTRLFKTYRRKKKKRNIRSIIIYIICIISRKFLQSYARWHIINYAAISISPSALFSTANLANWTPTAVGLHGTIVPWPRYVVVARRRCLQFDDKVNGIINKANGKRVFAAPCAHLACCGHKRVEEIIRKGPRACLPASLLPRSCGLKTGFTEL